MSDSMASSAVKGRDIKAETSNTITLSQYKKKSSDDSFRSKSLVGLKLRKSRLLKLKVGRPRGPRLVDFTGDGDCSTLPHICKNSCKRSLQLLKNMRRHHSIGKSLKCLEKVYGKMRQHPNQMMKDNLQSQILKQSDRSSCTADLFTDTPSSGTGCSNITGSDLPSISYSSESDEETSNKLNKPKSRSSIQKKSLTLKPKRKPTEKCQINHSEEHDYKNVGISNVQKTPRKIRQEVDECKSVSSDCTDVESFKWVSIRLVSSNSSGKWSHEVIGNNLENFPRIPISWVSDNVAWPEYWDIFLEDPSNKDCIAPVNLFKHAPFADIWKEFATPSLVIEVPNPYVKLKNQSVYWIAKIIRYSGYRALVQYERFDKEPTQSAWIPFCSKIPQPLGFAEMTGQTLYPALDVAKLHPNFIQKARDTLAKFGNCLFTLQKKHAKFVSEKIASHQIYKLGTKLEVIDVNALHRNQIAKVTAIIGDRIRVAYELPKKDVEHDLGHILNVKSEYVHPLGWSKSIGHDLYYIAENEQQPTSQIISAEDFYIQEENYIIKEGMALEIRNPQWPSEISFAFVSKVLKFGYFLAEVKAKRHCESFKICFHISSPYVLQCGFCQDNGIRLSHSGGEERDPNWDWRTQTRYEPLNFTQFPLHTQISRTTPHSFKEGMKLEAVDLVVHHIVCPATIVKIAGHLLKLHFDGRSKHLRKSYQWVAASSYDIYPLGWAEMVGHKFTGYPETSTQNIDVCSDPHIASGRNAVNSTVESEPLESEEDLSAYAYAESLMGGLALSECAGADFDLDTV